MITFFIYYKTRRKSMLFLTEKTIVPLVQYEEVLKSDQRVISLLNKAKDDKWLSTEVLSKFKGRYVHILKCDGKVAGFSLTHKNGKWWRAGVIYILPEYRGMSIATTYISTFFKGKESIAYIEPDNIGSIKAFLNSNFFFTGNQVVGSNGILYNKYMNRKS